LQHVADHSDDGDPVAVRAQPESPAERILARPAAVDQALADYCHRARVAVIARIERAPGEQTNAHRVEER
jgi:hypothetical protein